MADLESVKILFRFYSNLLEEETVETMWATVVNEKEGLYKLDNIPFYAPSIASDDVVFAEYDEDEQMLTFRHIVEFSGNSTVRVVKMDKALEINDVRNLFESLGCISEKLNDSYFAMDIPANIQYKPVKEKLENLKDERLIDYEESCLSDEHRY